MDRLGWFSTFYRFLIMKASLISLDNSNNDLSALVFRSIVIVNVVLSCVIFGLKIHSENKTRCILSYLKKNKNFILAVTDKGYLRKFEYVYSDLSQLKIKSFVHMKPFDWNCNCWILYLFLLLPVWPSQIASVSIWKLLESDGFNIILPRTTILIWKCLI